MTRLPDDREMEQAVRSWMRDDDERPPDRNRQVGRIMGRVDETRQRRGAWRLLPFRRGATRVDEIDEDLIAAGRGAGLVMFGRGGIAASLMSAMAVIALIATSFAFLTLRPSDEPVTPGAGASASASPQPTLDPADRELMARLEGVWSGQETSLDDVRDVYAQDAVHTALWHDTEERSVGPSDIWQRISDLAHRRRA